MSKLLYILLSCIMAVLWSSAELKGQDFAVIDSLKKVNSTEQDPKKIADNYAIIASKFPLNNVDSAQFYANAALELSTKIQYKKGQAEAHFLISYNYDLVGDYTASIKHMKQAIQLFIAVGDSSYLSGCYNNLGALYSYGSEQKKSLEYFIKSIQIGEELRDSFALGQSYSNVAGFYEDLKEYSSALKYFKKGLEVDLHYNYPEDVAISQLDVGYINTKLLRYDDALENLQKAQTLMNTIKEPFYQIILYQRLANYYKETRDLNQAESYILKAQKIGDSYDYPLLTAETLMIKGEILLKQEKFSKCIDVVDSAIAQNMTINSKSTLHELYKHKADAYFGLGKYSRAYEFLLSSEKEKKSLQSEKVAEVLSEFEKAEALKEERARLQLQQELENQKTENTLIKIRSKLYFTILIAVFLGIVVLIAFYFYLLKQNHNKRLEKNYLLINHQKELLEKNYTELKENEKRLAELNATKDKFFSIIAHDLKNPFNTLIGISQLMIRNPEIKETEDFEELVHGMFQTAQSGHNLLENLLEWSRSQIGNLKIEPKQISLNEIFSSTASFFQETARAKDISIVLDKLNGEEVYADYNMVNFISRNLVNNAIKFSHKGSKIHIKAESKGRHTVVHIKDQGIGMNEEIIGRLFKVEHSIQKSGTADEKGSGLGLILCKEFIEKNGGEIWVNSEEGKGSTFSFSLPHSAN